MYNREHPLVSAIVRSMDRASLDQALDSVGLQSYPHLEIVVVNAKGPGHRTPHPWRGAVPVRFIGREQALSRSQAANAGLDAAQGDLIFFLDDDDVIFVDHVATLVWALTHEVSARGAYAGIRVEHYRDGALTSVGVANQPFDRYRLWGRNFLPIHAVLFERSLVAEGCRFDEALDVYEDWDFWVQLTARTDLVHVDRITACYRNHGQSGFGLLTDPMFIRRAKAAYFDKWRLKWSGDQLSEIIERRESLLTELDQVTGRLQQEITRRQDEIGSQHQEIVLQCQEAARLQQEITRLQRETFRQHEDITRQQQQITQQADAIARQQQEIARWSLEVAQLQQDYGRSTEQVGALMVQLDAQMKLAHAAKEQAAQLDFRTAELEGTFAENRRALDRTQRESQAAQEQLRAVLQSRSWHLMAPYRAVGTTLRRANKARFLGVEYVREHGRGLRGTMRLLGTTARILTRDGPGGLMAAMRRFSGREHHLPALDSPAIAQALVRRPIVAHAQPVDIIVCVHNALDDVRRCLESVLLHTRDPYTLILVDDGSHAPTRDHLAQFAKTYGSTQLRNESARGYTLAANQGMAASRSPFVVLLNSDTVVAEGWLDRLVVCATSDDTIGIVGPLSNTASWQSIPGYEQSGDWAANALPEGIGIDDMAHAVATFSGQTYPRIGFLNGFCLMIKRPVIDRIGLFDEQVFASGYGEENDYCLRARKAGFALAVADDVYVYHAQSKSYSNERRKNLSELAGIALARKHGQTVIDEGVRVCRFDRVMEGLRAHASQLFERQHLIRRGQQLGAGKRIVIVLPAEDPGGGANVVISESRALRRMGVEVQLLNFARSQAAFEASYPGLDIPVIYAPDEAAIPGLCSGFDAAIATLNTSVFWLLPLQHVAVPKPVLGYYIQDFEPNFYAEGSSGFHTAMASYIAVADMVCVTKTEWNANVVGEKTGRSCTVLGPSLDVDLFRPRRRARPSWPDGPLRIAAMIRPSSPRRGPRLTMEVLQLIEREFGESVEIVLFGVNPAAHEFLALPNDFAWYNAGTQSPESMALLLNETDIFVDFSQYQAMGLTAMEAMACGVAVVVPESGGAGSFASHETDALFVDTANGGACHLALRRLVQDHDLRQKLQRQALASIAAHAPERPAVRLLWALFGDMRLRERDSSAVAQAAVGNVSAIA